eukprot:347602-Chlamydomonas_euryale.AAC.3
MWRCEKTFTLRSTRRGGLGVACRSPMPPSHLPPILPPPPPGCLPTFQRRAETLRKIGITSPISPLPFRVPLKGTLPTPPLSLKKLVFMPCNKSKPPPLAPQSAPSPLHTRAPHTARACRLLQASLCTCPTPAPHLPHTCPTNTYTCTHASPLVASICVRTPLPLLPAADPAWCEATMRVRVEMMA